MKKYFLSFILFFAFFAFNAPAYSGDGLKDKPFLKEVENMKAAKNKIFNLNIDIQLGLSSSKTNFTLNRVDSTTQNLSNPSSKLGPNIGAIVSIDFLGFGFTSGLQYSSKGFETIKNETTDFKYFNIPLLFYFDIDLGKVILAGNFGPYFGLLLSQNNDAPVVPFEVKNFDLGLTGDVQGAYMFQKHLGALLGVKYEYGGLNNLGNNEAIKSIRTSTVFVYTGIKFVL